MSEKDILQKITDDAKNVTPPEALSPEAVEQMLIGIRTHTAKHSQGDDPTDLGRTAASAQNAAAQRSFSFDKKSACRRQDFGNNVYSNGGQKNDIFKKRNASKRSARKKSEAYRYLFRCGSIAAVFVLALTVAWQANRISELSEQIDAAELQSSVLLETVTVSEEAADVTGVDASGSQTDSNAADAGASGSQTDSNASYAGASGAANNAGTDDSTADAAVSDSAAAAGSGSADITTDDTAEDAATDSDAIPEGLAENSVSGPASAEGASIEYTEALAYADSYESIYKTLYDKFYANVYSLSDSGVYYSTRDIGTNETTAADDVEYEIAATDTAETAAGAMSAAAATDDAADSYSGTNLQEAGVDEGDIVKTDGRYIYILRQDCAFVIVKAEGTSLEVVSTTTAANSSDACVQEMYLDGDTLNIITSEYVTSLENEDNIYYTNGRWQTVLRTYDVTDRSLPVLAGTVTQDGYYEDSRKNGQYLYLFTSWYPDIYDTYEESTVAPLINGIQAKASSFYLPETLTSSSYLVISSVSLAAPDEIMDSKVLVSGVSYFYVSTSNIYITNTTYSSDMIRTEITKFHYADGAITGIAADSVKGYLNNSFSLNEYGGNLRVVSTYYDEDWEEHNALYVLDGTLQQIGAIEGLAEGETIRSARFLGDIGYFVTYEQTDPLFSVDLSDPTDPQILGKLKISGFSSYLHFYGDGLLLGIGYESDENTGIVTGVKLSMFDISDPTNVVEKDRFVISGITWCPAIENYKMILVDPDKNVIGFYCDERYMVFSYDEENGFTRELLYDFYEDMLSGETSYYTMRGLYIGGMLYLAGDSYVISFDMADSFQKTGILTF